MAKMMRSNSSRLCVSCARPAAVREDLLDGHLAEFGSVVEEPTVSVAVARIRPKRRRLTGCGVHFGSIFATLTS